MFFSTLVFSKDFNTYEHQEGEKTARVKTDSGHITGCFEDNKGYVFKIDSDGYARIPTNGRFTIVDSFVAERGLCTVRTKFLPLEGEAYHIHMVHGYSCQTSVYKETQGNEIGVAVEPTQQKGQACSFYWDR